MKKAPERFRITEGPLASDSNYGNNGAFLVPHKRPRFNDHCLLCIASDGMDWEHVSVSHVRANTRGQLAIMPTWEDMCFVKGLFWGEHEAVMQLHPPKSEYVNNHKYCLHLWKPVSKELPLPDSVLV